LLLVFGKALLKPLNVSSDSSEYVEDRLAEKVCSEDLREAMICSGEGEGES
jgi:hypothetical protein